VISFRDLDQQRLYDVMAEGAPEFKEKSLFIIRDKSHFDPGTDWTFELLVRRQTGPVDGVFTSFELGYPLPEVYFGRPALTEAELADIEEASRPLGLYSWYQKRLQIRILLT